MVFTQQNITSTISQIIAGESNRKTLFIRNIGNNVAFIGGSSVSHEANNNNGGYPISPGNTLVLNNYTGSLHSRTSTGSTTLNIVTEIRS